MNNAFILSLILLAIFFMLPVENNDTLVAPGSVSAPEAKVDPSCSPLSPAAGHSRKKEIILLEFDGKHKPGQWDIHEYKGEFPYSAGKSELSMDGSDGMNRHITRRGIMIDPGKPYVIEADFTINEPVDAPVPNSFCINFNIAGEEDQLDSLFCWSMNLDISPEGSQHAGVMKTMGFVNGGFREIRPERKVVEWCRMNRAYHIVIEAGKNTDDRFLQHIVTVSVFEGSDLKEHFTTDYSTFPYQPDNSMPVRLGLNTHGADWTLRNLKVCQIK